MVKDGYEKTNIWEIHPNNKSWHPAPFPEELSNKIIQYYSYENETVLDPFAGSGTVGISCKKLNRKFILIEKNEDYFYKMKKSVENTNKIKSVF